jgi:hypothetical protein
MTRYGIGGHPDVGIGADRGTAAGMMVDGGWFMEAAVHHLERNSGQAARKPKTEDRGRKAEDRRDARATNDRKQGR